MSPYTHTNTNFPHPPQPQERVFSHTPTIHHRRLSNSRMEHWTLNTQLDSHDTSLYSCHQTECNTAQNALTKTTCCFTRSDMYSRRSTLCTRGPCLHLSRSVQPLHVHLCVIVCWISFLFFVFLFKSPQSLTCSLLLLVEAANTAHVPPPPYFMPLRST